MKKPLTPTLQQVLDIVPKFQIELLEKLVIYNRDQSAQGISAEQTDQLAKIRRMINGSITDTGCGTCRAAMMHDIIEWLKSNKWFNLIAS